MLEHVRNAPHSLSWSADLYLELCRMGVGVTPALEHLIPLAPVVAWALDLRHDPVPADIIERWGADRSTAFRWRRILARARSEHAALVEAGASAGRRSGQHRPPASCTVGA